MGHPSRRPPAFTLIEILGVLTLIAILLALTIPVLQKTRAQAKLARAKSDIQKIESSLNLYRLDYGIIPTPSDAPRLLSATSGGDFSILNATSTGPGTCGSPADTARARQVTTRHQSVRR